MASKGIVSFFASSLMFFRSSYILLYISSVGMEDELLLGECSLGHFRPCSSEVVKVYMLTTQILAIHSFALWIILAWRHSTYADTCRPCEICTLA